MILGRSITALRFKTIDAAVLSQRSVGGQRNAEILDEVRAIHTCHVRDCRYHVIGAVEFSRYLFENRVSESGIQILSKEGDHPIHRESVI